MIGMVLGLLISVDHAVDVPEFSPHRVDKWFRRLQLVSAAMYSLGHGTNDAQKTMGIIAGVLLTAGYLDTFRIPFWVILSAHAAIALGTLSGGWRIVHTMGSKITKLQPFGGFAAETAGAITLFTASALGVPVSTDSHDHRRHHRRRIGQAGVCGPVGRGETDRVGLGPDDSRVGLIAAVTYAVARQLGAQWQWLGGSPSATSAGPDSSRDIIAAEE